MKKIAVIVMLIIGSILIGGCGNQSEQEKHFKQVNEDRKKAEEEGKKAAEATRNMDTSVKPVAPKQENKK